MTCSEKGCMFPARTNGHCTQHQWKAGGDMSGLNQRGSTSFRTPSSYKPRIEIRPSTLNPGKLSYVWILPNGKEEVYGATHVMSRKNTVDQLIRRLAKDFSVLSDASDVEIIEPPAPAAIEEKASPTTKPEEPTEKPSGLVVYDPPLRQTDRVLAAVRAGHKTVKEIMAATGISSSSTTATLSTLRRGGYIRILNGDQVGPTNYEAVPGMELPPAKPRDSKMAWEELRDFLSTQDGNEFSETELATKINRGKATVQNALYCHRDIFWQAKSGGTWRMRLPDDNYSARTTTPAVSVPTDLAVHAVSPPSEFPLKISVNVEEDHVSIELSEEVDYVKCSPRGARVLAESLTEVAEHVELSGREGTVTGKTVTSTQVSVNLKVDESKELAVVIPDTQLVIKPTPFTDIPAPSKFWSPIPEHGPYLKRLLQLTMEMALSEKGTPEDDARHDRMWEEFCPLTNDQWDWAEAKRITDEALGEAWSEWWDEALPKEKNIPIENDPASHWAWEAMHAALIPVIKRMRELDDEVRRLNYALKSSTGSPNPA